MKLLPSLKQRKRYLVFKIRAEKTFSAAEIQEAVEQALQDFLGQLGMARAAPLFFKDLSQNNQFVLKINHHYVDEVKSALILIKKIKNTPVLLHSITTSGILKKAVAAFSQS
ncbi:hypothetical protein HY495_03855 [Candidatus Woesearchaeota archaeon]|nr:hypothetical protein [Candidatus Woesearchaeota archaeon]